MKHRIDVKYTKLLTAHLHTLIVYVVFMYFVVDVFLFFAQVSALCSALLDKNVLVGRAILDIVSVLFPLHQSFLIPADLTTILSAALQTLLKRDVSLNRRLYAWLLGTNVDKSHLANRLHSTISPKHERKFLTNDASDGNENLHSEPSYFEAFSKTYLVDALKMIISQASLSAKHGMYKAECILPYRLLRALVDKPELGLPLLDEVMFDLVCCLKQQISDLGGLGSPSQTKGAKLNMKLRGTTVEEALSKRPGKKGALKADILQSSSLFFNSLDSEVLFRWTTDLLRSTFSRQQAKVSENATPDPRKDGQADLKEKQEENLAEESVQIVNREGSHSSSPTVELDEADKSESRQQGEEGEGEERRNSQPEEQMTTSNQVSASESSVVAAVDAKPDLSYVLELIKFLIQSLPLVSVNCAKIN